MPGLKGRSGRAAMLAVAGVAVLLAAFFFAQAAQARARPGSVLIAAQTEATPTVVVATTAEPPAAGNAGPGTAGSAAPILIVVGGLCFAVALGSWMLLNASRGH